MNNSPENSVFKNSEKNSLIESIVETELSLTSAAREIQISVRGKSAKIRSENREKLKEILDRMNISNHLEEEWQSEAYICVQMPRDELAKKLCAAGVIPESFRNKILGAETSRLAG